MNIHYFYLLLLSSIPLMVNGIASDKIIQSEQQAEAFFAAKDEKRVSDIYLELLKLKLPEWQKERVLYNLGTVKLASYNAEEALKNFYAIDLKSSSYPLLVQYVITGQGLTYLQKAVSSAQIEAKAILLDNSLQTLSSAKKIACQRQQKEEKTNSCLYPTKLVDGLRFANAQSFELKQQERLQLFNADRLDQQLLILQNSLKRLDSFIAALASSDFPFALKESYSTFINTLTADTIPLWKALQEQPISATQKLSIDTAYENYLHAVELIQSQKWSQAQEQLQASQEALKKVDIADKLLYEILIDQASLLSQNLYSLISLENIQEKLAKLLASNEKNTNWQQAQSYLSLALEAVKKTNLAQAEFFLWASFYQLNNPEKVTNEQNEALDVLQKALNNAKASLKLNFIGQKIQDRDAKISDTIKKFQSATVQEADLFLATVKTQEKDHFQKLTQDTNYPRCQHYPWERTIPLFEKGYQAATYVQNQLDQSSPTHSTLDQQVETISYWQQALDSMNQEIPPESAQSQTSQAEDIQNVFTELQEMELEDTPKKKTEGKELQGW